MLERRMRISGVIVWRPWRSEEGRCMYSTRMNCAHPYTGPILNVSHVFLLYGDLSPHLTSSYGLLIDSLRKKMTGLMSLS